MELGIETATVSKGTAGQGDVMTEQSWTSLMLVHFVNYVKRIETDLKPPPYLLRLTGQKTVLM
jgi:hypothetical protein